MGWDNAGTLRARADACGARCATRGAVAVVRAMDDDAMDIVTRKAAECAARLVREGMAIDVVMIDDAGWRFL
jgi:hypothetical protein